MENIRYANAMTEVLEYLKGIRQEDIDKIPKKLILFFKENASTNYICNIDYNRPLKEQQLLDETRGLISMLCLNYWCETEEQKKRSFSCKRSFYESNKSAFNKQHYPNDRSK